MDSVANPPRIHNPSPLNIMTPDEAQAIGNAGAAIMIIILLIVMMISVTR